MQAAIPFPDLSPELFSFTLGSFEFALRWYALAYIAGILLGWRIALRSVSQPAFWQGGQAVMTREQVDDFLTWSIIGIIVGGRLGFVLFYQPGYYLQNPGEILAVWQGGMAFHGGLLGVVLAAWIYTGRHGIARRSAADLIALAVPAGLFFGRVANFINAELWGRPTDLPWGVIFPGNAAQDCPGVLTLCARHPSQLYEALLEGLILGLVLLWLAWQRGAFHKPGLIAGVFFCGIWRSPVRGRVRAPARCAVRVAWESAGTGLSYRRYWAHDGTDPVRANDPLGSMADPDRAHTDRGMTLAPLLRSRLAAQGPMTVADYMSECLLHPEYGYYTTRDPLGRSGDFITSPEISQMFGELIGLSLAQAWLDQGAPARFVFAEAGPGRGTLMADALRAVRNIPGFVEAAQIVLIEASPKLRASQAMLLVDHAPDWIDHLDDLPEGPLYFIANEFFDALPIRQFQRDGSQWRERQIGLVEDTLTFGLGPAQPQPALANRLDDTRDGDVVEYCPSAAPAISLIGGRISQHGGAALIVDYGDWRSLGDTLQALRGHESVDPLETPGDADLTAHVDFEALASAAPCARTRLTPQGVFLERLGITQRAQLLSQTLTGPALDQLVAAHRRLTHPEEMGNLFKVLGLYPNGGSPPPGLDP